MQMLSAAGANGTSNTLALPWDINVHQMRAVVVTAGTSATSGNQVFLLSGTTSVTSSSIALGTGTAGTGGTTGDLATLIPAGTLISLKNGTDATGVARVMLEFNLAPATATWLGNE
jgi:hypothetical protein